MAFPILTIILLLGILTLIVLPIVLLIVLLGRRGKVPVVANPPPSISPADRQQRREAILEQLASKEISQEEAEHELLELDNPVPGEMPAPPPTQQGRGCGCLAAVIIALVLGLLLFVLVILGLFTPRATVSHGGYTTVEHVEVNP